MNPYLWRSCLSFIEEPEKKPETLGLEDPDIWGDAAENVSACPCQILRVEAEFLINQSLPVF